MNRTITTCLDDPRELWDRRICLHEVSKNVSGELSLLERDLQDCERQPCRTLKSDHALKVEVSGHEPCDSKLGGTLDGVLYVRRLVTAFADGSGEQRGLHTGRFEWVGVDLRVRGTLSGITNAGTHRESPFDPCQECHAPGYMEGRLCGYVIKSRRDELVGCAVSAAYRLRFDPSEGANDTEIRGTIEGLIVCPCATDENCLDFTGFATMSHPNPWSVAGHSFHVFDFAGVSTTTADVVSWGGFTGLNVNYETRIGLSAPVSGVDITLAHFSSPATVSALDGDGTVVDTETMVSGGGVAETLSLSGDIESLLVEAPQNETLLLELCTS